MGERLDETYNGHSFYVSPKLSRLPSEILYSHIVATTHREKGCIATLAQTGADCVIWSDDYPHAEGSYPNTKPILDGLFDGFNVSQADKNRVVVGTCAKLYKLDAAKAKAEKQAFLTATA